MLKNNISIYIFETIFNECLSEQKINNRREQSSFGSFHNGNRSLVTLSISFDTSLRYFPFSVSIFSLTTWKISSVWLHSGFLLDLPSPTVSSFRRSLMKSIVWSFIFLSFFPFIVHPCTINEILLKRDSTDVIFSGRILSLHRWSVDHPYSAFVWVFRVLHGEHRLLQHYSWKEMQHPLYIIVDHLEPCHDGSTLKANEDKILGIQIRHARFYSNFAPLNMTINHLQLIEGKWKSSSKKWTGALSVNVDGIWNEWVNCSSSSPSWSSVCIGERLMRTVEEEKKR